MSDTARVLEIPDCCTVNPPQIPAASPHPLARLGLPFRFTKENARHYSVRGVEARRKIAAETPPIAVTPVPDPVLPESSPELVRARAQLDGAQTRLEEALERKSTLPIDIERLTRAVTALGERVRILEGRPLPGNRRPGPERRPRESSGSAPLD